MKRRRFLFAYLISGILAVIMSGCGGGGGNSVTPPPPPTKGTLRITNVPLKTIVTVSGQQYTPVSGVIQIELEPGTYSVSAQRSGYTLSNESELQSIEIKPGLTTEKSLSFSRRQPPLPPGWTGAAAREVAAK